MKPSRRTVARRPSRGVLAVGRAATRHATITQDVAAIDHFGELPARKADALRVAHDKAHGHQLGPWHERPNDVYGRWNAHCVDCGAVAVVALEPPPNLALSYGTALTRRCTAAEDEEVFEG